MQDLRCQRGGIDTREVDDRVLPDMLLGHIGEPDAEDEQLPEFEGARRRGVRPTA